MKWDLNRLQVHYLNQLPYSTKLWRQKTLVDWCSKYFDEENISKLVALYSKLARVKITGRLIVNHQSTKFCTTIHCLFFMVKNFCCFTSLHSFLKNVHGYQLIYISLVVFTCKKLPEYFHDCKAVCNNKRFSPQIISIIRYMVLRDASL